MRAAVGKLEEYSDWAREVKTRADAAAQLAEFKERHGKEYANAQPDAATCQVSPRLFMCFS